MKALTTILAAAFIAGGATIALAQAGGGDLNPDRVGKGADENPSIPGANPAAGSTDADSKARARTGTSQNNNMRTAPVSGTTKSDNSSTPSQAPTGTSK